MKVGIIGTGRIGKALTTALTHKGIPVMVGSRDPQKANELAGQMHHFATGGSITHAIHYGEIIILAVPYKAVEETLRQAGSLKGKIIVDCTNPLTFSDDVHLAIGHRTSGAEQIAKMAPDAKVVKAFNTAFSHLMEEGPYFGANDASMFYCGDDQEAKDQVKVLIEAVGFEAVDSGPLYSARELEPMAALIIRLARLGAGNEIAYKLLKR